MHKFSNYPDHIQKIWARYLTEANLIKSNLSFSNENISHAYNNLFLKCDREMRAEGYCVMVSYRPNGDLQGVQLIKNTKVAKLLYTTKGMKEIKK